MLRIFEMWIRGNPDRKIFEGTLQLCRGFPQVTWKGRKFYDLSGQVGFLWEKTPLRQKAYQGYELPLDAGD